MAVSAAQSVLGMPPMATNSRGVAAHLASVDQGGYLVTGPDLLTNGKAPASWPLERAPYYLETAVPGSFAAGDVRHRSIKRVPAAAGRVALPFPFVHGHLDERAGAVAGPTGLPA